MARMSNKLTGRDFSTCSSISTNTIQHAVDHNTLIPGDTREVDHGLSVKLQVQKLIIQARSHENLCQNYVGYEIANLILILPYFINKRQFPRKNSNRSGLHFYFLRETILILGIS